VKTVTKTAPTRKPTSTCRSAPLEVFTACGGVKGSERNTSHGQNKRGQSKASSRVQGVGGRRVVTPRSMLYAGAPPRGARAIGRGSRSGGAHHGGRWVRDRPGAAAVLKWTVRPLPRVQDLSSSETGICVPVHQLPIPFIHLCGLT
jgi:hypothetical protein